MAPAPPGPSQHRNGRSSFVRATDGGTPMRTSLEASAELVEASGGSKVHPDDVAPRNRKARRAAAAKARRG